MTVPTFEIEQYLNNIDWLWSIGSRPLGGKLWKKMINFMKINSELAQPLKKLGGWTVNFEIFFQKLMEKSEREQKNKEEAK